MTSALRSKGFCIFLRSVVNSNSSCSRLSVSRNAFDKPLTISRNLHKSSRTQDIFNVQDDADFKKRVVQNSKPVLVEFHATWCGPCKVLMPRMERAMAGFSSKVDMAKVDIDEMPDLAMEYNVGAVPAVMVMKKGQIVDKFVGLKDEDQITTFIANVAK